MASREDVIKRARLIDERIRQRTDIALRDWLANYEGELDYFPLDKWMISETAWAHVQDSGIEPRMAFAHPVLLQEQPPLSAYYRGVALLSQKQVSDLALSVVNWENPAKRPRVTVERSTKLSRLYNVVISSIIEGATDWTIENGYRNIIANMGIGLDGTVRNLIGQDAERAIKDRIGEWLESVSLIETYSSDQTTYALPNDYFMRFASEPDIEFRHVTEGTERVIATIEIKGGKDRAGALERLGAIQKSFEATPPSCTNMLIAGVVTSEMAERLDQLGIIRRFLLDDLAGDDAKWAAFLNEVFHHTVRIMDAPITEMQV